jgi:hypothetical protein
MVMAERKMSRFVYSSIGIFLAFFLFAGWGVAEVTVHTGVQYTDKAELEAIKRDLDKIDQASADGNYADASVIVGRDIKARDIYRLYLERASSLSEELLAIRQRLEGQENTLSLQELGAITQRLSLDNLGFKGTFKHGEERFQTYQLIQKAIINLEEAIDYWRTANHYRRFFRGGQWERVEDDQILKTKLQTAMNTIDELKGIIDTRNALSKDLLEE